MTRKTWVRHGSRDQKPLKKGELIRRRLSMGKYEYGRADGGFGMNADTVGGSLFVKPARGQAGSVKEKVRWHRDGMHIERVTSRRKPKSKGKK